MAGPNSVACAASMLQQLLSLAKLPIRTLLVQLLLRIGVPIRTLLEQFLLLIRGPNKIPSGRIPAFSSRMDYNLGVG